ncbi:thioredoxin family protein [Hyphomicrobium sp. CS1GBMeth3]|uniref:thioredoxin family protein n=1 Tax=Hyphomicrobium sp. CS1GBMeth3 TaxID=1892845 RepID=UPI00092FDCEB|nr:thioredoxin family protein [Hyphomicrobium sp. CS1GBMeth3]
MPTPSVFRNPRAHFTLVAATLSLLVSVAAGQRSVAAQQPNMAEQWNGGEIAWRDVGPGIQEASRTGQPVVMLFHASWCGSCRRYRAVWKDPGVVAASKNFVMILVDVDKHPDANGAFSPDGTYVPRTIFYTAEGDVMKDAVGKDTQYPHTIDLDDPTELRTLMQKAASQAATRAPEPHRRAEN